MALHAEPTGQQPLILKATEFFDRIDFALNWMDGKEIKEINKELAAICKRHDIGKIVTDKEGNPRLSNMPSTEEVVSKSGKTKKKGKSKDKSKTSNRNGDTMPTKTPELTKAEVRQYMEDHMIDMRGTFEKKAAYVAEHMVNHGKLVKKGLERLLALIEKHDIPFKDDRRKREEVRASIAADAILADGYVVEGKGIAKPGDDEDEAPVKSKKTSTKATSSKEDSKSSKKSTAKSTSSKRSRKDEDEEDDDEEEEKPAKKSSKVKTKEKTSTKSKKRSRDDDEDETPKKSSKVRSKRKDDDDEEEAPRKKKTSSSSSKTSSKVTSTKKKSRK